MDTINIAVTLITQGNHQFYSGTIEIDIIAATCSANPRELNTENGFQRRLDERRADAIAEYVKAGGTIPSSIILSAQKSAELKYSARNKTITFNIVDRAFLILDGQHRVYGFRKLMSDGLKYRVPVIIYNSLDSVSEARLFIDINTLQKPVPKELLLDIKKLADRESAEESMLDELFTSFELEPDSYLLNKLTRVEKKKGHLSKVTFYDSLRPTLRNFEIENTSKLYQIVNSYLHACDDLARESKFSLNEVITKPTVFKILMTHMRTVISLISDSKPNALSTISEHKRYLKRSLPTAWTDIVNSSSHLKSAEILDKRLFKKRVVI